MTPNAKAKRKSTPTLPYKAAPKYNEHILDADFVAPVIVSAEEEETPPLFEQLYDLDALNDKDRDRLPEVLRAQLVYLSVFQKHDLPRTFMDNNVYLSCEHPLAFWPVHLNASLLSKARLRHTSWSF